jgi:hypothetical protein
MTQWQRDAMVALMRAIAEEAIGRATHQPRAQGAVEEAMRDFELSLEVDT